MRQPIRRQPTYHAIALAAGLLAFSASAAYADDWCGYGTRDNAIIQCGYTTVAGCESAVGKGGMCFVDPDTALNIRRTTPINANKAFGISGQTPRRG
jgi:hypothetical protein